MSFIKQVLQITSSFCAFCPLNNGDYMTHTALNLALTVEHYINFPVIKNSSETHHFPHVGCCVAAAEAFLHHKDRSRGRQEELIHMRKTKD